MAQQTWGELDWDELLDFIDGGFVVPIVGPELLRLQYQGRECNLHQLLAHLFAAKFKLSAQDLPAGEELHTIACRYLKTNPVRESLYLWLNSLMPLSEEITLPEPLLKLAEIEPFRMFITTNFDSLLTQALDQTRFGANSGATQVFAFSLNNPGDLPDEAGAPPDPTVYHIFGKLSPSPDDYVVTQEDTLEWVTELQRSKPEALLDYISQRNLLVLGCGFAGWLARFFIRAQRRGRLLDTNGIDYFADQMAFRDEKLVQFLHQFRSPFRAKFWPQGGALEFVDELHRRWATRRPTGRTKAADARRRPHLEPVRPVFISYAHEDSDVAERIGKAIREKGVKVFFGPESVQFGEDFGDRIERCIESCSLFVPVLSKSTMNRDEGYFLREWNLALDRLEGLRRIFIMPVAIDDTQPSNPGVPKGFKALNWTRLQDGNPSEAFLRQVVTNYKKCQLT